MINKLITTEGVDFDEMWEKVLAALRSLRTGVVRDEKGDLHRAIAQALENGNLNFYPEHRLGPHNRIDFFVEPGIGIEVKRKRPNQANVMAQLERYTTFPIIRGIILIQEGNLDLGDSLNGKPLITLSLHKMWGVAL